MSNFNRLMSKHPGKLDRETIYKLQMNIKVNLDQLEEYGECYKEDFFKEDSIKIRISLNNISEIIRIESEKKNKQKGINK